MVDEGTPRDYLEGSFIINIDLSKDAEGNTVATAMGLEEKSYSQEIAISKLQERLQEGIEKGEITPYA